MDNYDRDLLVRVLENQKFKHAIHSKRFLALDEQGLVVWWNNKAYLTSLGITAAESWIEEKKNLEDKLWWENVLDYIGADLHAFVGRETAVISINGGEQTTIPGWLVQAIMDCLDDGCGG